MSHVALSHDERLEMTANRVLSYLPKDEHTPFLLWHLSKLEPNEGWDSTKKYVGEEVDEEEGEEDGEDEDEPPGWHSQSEGLGGGLRRSDTFYRKIDDVALEGPRYHLLQAYRVWVLEYAHTLQGSREDLPWNKMAKRMALHKRKREEPESVS